MGLITRPTKSEDASTTMSVMGRNFMNSPIMPGHNSSGTNTATVVAVLAMIGQATSPMPFLAARIGDCPSLIRRWVFSITTMPLSTSMPRASTSAKSTIMFRV